MCPLRVCCQIEVLVESCTSLILVLRRCAEQLRTKSLSPADVDPCLKAALQVRGASKPVSNGQPGAV